MTLRHQLVIGLIAGVTAAWAAGAQEHHWFASGDGQVKLKFVSFKGNIPSNANKPSTLTGVDTYQVAGGFEAISVKQGLDCTGDHATATVGKFKKDSIIKTLDAFGHVVMTKTVGTPVGQRKTVIQGSVAHYKDGTLESTIDLSGPVKIVDTDEAKRQTVVATGSSGQCFVVNGKSSKASPLKHALLHGPVAVKVDQAPTGSEKPGVLSATGDEMVFDARGAHPDLVLTGNVSMVGSNGQFNGKSEHLDKVTIHLNESQEMTGFETGPSTGAPLMALLQGTAQTPLFEDDLGDLSVFGVGAKTSLAGNLWRFVIPAAADIKKRSEGLELTADEVDGHLKPKGKEGYELMDATATGDAKLVIDSGTADAYTRAHGVTPEAGPVSHTVLTSAELKIVHQDNGYDISTSQPFKLIDDRTSEDRLNTDQSTLTGTSATFNFRPQTIPGKKTQQMQIQTGIVEGPLHYHVIRTPAKGEPSEYDVVGDHATLDFTKPEGTIVVTGHVHFHQIGSPGWHGDYKKVTLTTDADHHISTWNGDGGTTILPAQPGVKG